MRILLVNHYAVGPAHAGGTRHHRLAAQWDAVGNEVRILRSSFNHFAPGAVDRLPAIERIGRCSTLESLPSRAYAGNGAQRALGMLEFARRVWQMTTTFRAADVVIGSSPQPLAALAAMAKARRHRRPFVFEIRDLWPQTLVDLGSLDPSGPMARVLYRLERILIEKADGVVFIPPSSMDYFTEKGLRPRASLHVPNLADVGELESPSPAASPVLEWIAQRRRSGALLFCYAGTLGRANDLDAVVEAFRSRGTDDAALVVCGDGPERERLCALAQGDPRIFFAGQLSRKDALAVVEASDVAVFHLTAAPVFKYGLSPNKLMDYLARGKPILYAGPDVLSPVTGSGAHLSARPSDTASICEAIVRFLTMTNSQRELMGRCARQHVEHTFSTESLASDYLKFLEAMHMAGKK